MKIGRLKDHLLGIGNKNVFHLVFLGKYCKKLNNGQDFSVVSIFTACFSGFGGCEGGESYLW